MQGPPTRARPHWGPIKADQPPCKAKAPHPAGPPERAQPRSRKRSANRNPACTPAPSQPAADHHQASRRGSTSPAKRRHSGCAPQGDLGMQGPPTRVMPHWGPIKADQPPCKAKAPHPAGPPERAQPRSRKRSANRNPACLQAPNQPAADPQRLGFTPLTGQNNCAIFSGRKIPCSTRARSARSTMKRP